MQLIDAILAFSLTMAALATIVTVIMEACSRITRMRKKNFVEEMKLLNKELNKGTLDMTDDERWNFFVRVVENPIEASIEKLRPEWENLSIEERLAFFGRDKMAGIGYIQRFLNFALQLFGDKKRTGLYEKVSLEYMLRCLADTESVKLASINESERLKVEFNRIARKYEEIGSSVSASFKHHAQAWSIAIGIGLALFANIDGLRIFEAYWVNPNLAKTVIEMQDAFVETQQEGQVNQQKNKPPKDFEGAWENLQEAEASMDKEAIIQKAKELKDAELAHAEQISKNDIQQTAQQQLADLVALGVPLGWKMYPNCPFGGSVENWNKSSPKCKTIEPSKRDTRFEFLSNGIMNTLFNDTIGFCLWFLTVVMTGVLIGLGAPFWFDVARRLSQMRKGVQNANASTEYRLSAKDANGDSKIRKEIIEDVLSDAAGEMKAVKTPLESE